MLTLTLVFQTCADYHQPNELYSDSLTFTVCIQLSFFFIGPDHASLHHLVYHAPWPGGRPKVTRGTSCT